MLRGRLVWAARAAVARRGHRPVLALVPGGGQCHARGMAQQSGASHEPMGTARPRITGLRKPIAAAKPAAARAGPIARGARPRGTPLSKVTARLSANDFDAESLPERLQLREPAPDRTAALRQPKRMQPLPDFDPFDGAGEQMASPARNPRDRLPASARRRGGGGDSASQAAPHRSTPSAAATATAPPAAGATGVPIARIQPVKMAVEDLPPWAKPQPQPQPQQQPQQRTEQPQQSNSQQSQQQPQRPHAQASGQPQQQQPQQQQPDRKAKRGSGPATPQEQVAARRRREQARAAAIRRARGEPVFEASDPALHHPDEVPLRDSTFFGSLQQSEQKVVEQLDRDMEQLLYGDKTAAEAAAAAAAGLSPELAAAAQAAGGRAAGAASGAQQQSSPRAHLKQLFMRVHPDRLQHPTDHASVRATNEQSLAALNAILDFHSQLTKRQAKADADALRAQVGHTAPAGAAAEPQGTAAATAEKEPAPPPKQLITFYFRTADAAAAPAAAAAGDGADTKAQAKANGGAAFGKASVEVHVTPDLKGKDAIVYLDKCFLLLLQRVGVDLPLMEVLQWRADWDKHERESGRAAGPGGAEELDDDEAARRARFASYWQYHRTAHAAEQPNLSLLPFMSAHGLVQWDEENSTPISPLQRLRCMRELRVVIENHFHDARCSDWAGFGVFVTHRFGAPHNGFFCIPWNFRPLQLVDYFNEYADAVVASAPRPLARPPKPQTAAPAAAASQPPSSSTSAV